MSTDFLCFLKDAKRATYAAQNGFASLQPALPGTKQLEYSHGDYVYRDIYAGMNFFVGQELVYLRTKPVWSMAYSGGLLIDASEAAVAEIYGFLREALRNAPTELPVRGPATLRAGQLAYSCQTEGDLERFNGIETIALGGSAVYELTFSGGSLK